MLPEVEEDKLTQLNRRYRPALMSFFLRRLHNHAEAEDLTQEVFVRLATLRGGQQIAHADAYVFQAAANLLRDRGRREKVRTDYRAGIQEQPNADVGLLDPVRVLAGQETLAELVAGLRELGERTRQVFILYRLENMKKRDIADIYRISISAVDKHLLKAMAHLTRRLGEPK